jgi:hypothetical protein
MSSKYIAGDEVVLTHIFKREPYGQLIKCAPFRAIVKKAEYTPTYGYAYTLMVGDETLSVCYWEEDIDSKIDSCCCDEELMWKTWGDQ